jgi:hypothetical protein
MDDGRPAERASHLPPGWNWQAPDYRPVYERRLAMLRRLRAHPELVQPLRQQYAEDWHSFINDWAITHEPRNPERGLPANIPFLMFQRQEEFVTWVYNLWRQQRNGICDKSRDSGATWLCCWIALCMWLFVDGAVVGFGSRKEEYVDNIGDPKAIFPKLRRAIAGIPPEFRPAGYDERKHATYMLLRNPANGNVIVGEAGDNIGRGNRTSIYFVDEAGFLEHPQLIEAALAETTNCRIDVSTAPGMDTPFYRKRTSGVISTFTFHWRDDPRKGPEWYEAKKANINDPVVVAQEIDIDYAAAVDNQAVDPKLIERAQNTPKSAVSLEGPRFLGVDVARFGSAESVMSDRKHRALLLQQCWRKLDTEQVAGKVIEYVNSVGGIKKFGAICIDDIGVGGGVTDKLKRVKGWKRKVVGVNVGDSVEDGIHGNLRARLVSDVVAWLKDAPNHLPNDPELKLQAASIRKDYRGGLIWIESKEQMRKRGVKSGDRFDSLCLSFASPAIEDEDDEPLVAAREPFDRGVAW